MHPQQVCRWHSAEWCGQQTWETECHPGGSGQAQEMGLCELHEDQEGQVQGPVSGSRHPPVSRQAGGWRDWEPCWEGLGSTGGWKAGHESPVCTGSPKGQLHLGLHPQQHGQQVDGGDSAPLLCSGETPLGVLCPALEPSAQERHGPVGGGPEECHKNDRRDGTPLLWGKAERIEAVQPGEEKAPGRFYCSLSVHKGGLEERWGQSF